MVEFEHDRKGPKIARISGHALSSAMTRWNLGSLVEARMFIEERLEDPEVLPHRSRKKASRDKVVFVSGDATFIGKKAGDGYEIVTAIRGGQITRKMLREGLLRRKSR